MVAKLTEKQRRFVEAYMGEAAGNATAAARIAGYRGSAKTLGVVGVENLRKPSIRDAIDERVAESHGVAERQERQVFWTRVMNDPEAKMTDRLRASELLGKSQADFIVRIGNPDGTPLNAPPPRLDLSKLSDEELRIFHELAVKAAPASSAALRPSN